VKKKTKYKHEPLRGAAGGVFSPKKKAGSTLSQKRPEGKSAEKIIGAIRF